MAIIDKSNDFFNCLLYSGNGSSGHAITGVGFSPNMVWMKKRDGTPNHYLWDTVRGVEKANTPNDARPQSDQVNGLTAFGSDGFTVGSDGDVNSGSMVSWNWKAGTSVSGNTGGSGTAKSYSGSVNTDSGVSIISYTGNGSAGHTIPHHLGAVPQLVIIKVTIGDTNNWGVYHHSMGATKAMYLDGAGAETNDSFLNNTTPSSSAVTLGGSGMTNANGNTFVMYSFSPKQFFSKFGKYKGNGSSNGQVVYTGFSPAFVIIKNRDAGEAWQMFDNQRLTFNQPNGRYSLNCNLSSAEYQGAPLIDLLSGGFKLTTNTNSLNVTQNYIYWAFASNPFVTSTDNNSIPGLAV